MAVTGPLLGTRVERLPPVDTALLVVDMQVVYLDQETGWTRYLRERDPAGHAYFAERAAGTLVPNVVTLVRSARKAGVPVVYTANGYVMDGARDYLRTRRGQVRDIGFVPRVDSREYRIIDSCRPGAAEIVLRKFSTSAFTTTGLDALLHNLDVANLVVCGTATDACVGLTARDAADRGYVTVLAADATATYSQARQDHFVEMFGSYHGDVWSTGAIVEEWRG